MLFYENFIMGIGSLVIGIILGTFLSKLFVAILLRLMNDALPSRFIFSWSAVINASLVFVLVTLITSLLSFWTIYRNSLLDLFHSEAKREKALKPSLLWTCIALTFIITGYVIALQPLTVQNSIWSILGVPLTSLLILFFTIVGTVLFISFFLPYFLKKITHSKSFILSWDESCNKCTAFFSHLFKCQDALCHCDFKCDHAFCNRSHWQRLL
nr:ABC transporter permease [Listeria aquatica]